MKKSSFIAMILGTVSGVLFMLGMCMALIPEWDTMNQGIIFGCAGILLGIITLMIWRKMEHKVPVKISAKTVLIFIFGIIGVLALGVGMCFTMVWNHMILGVVIGLAGIVVLLSLIPFIKGIK